MYKAKIFSFSDKVLSVITGEDRGEVYRQTRMIVNNEPEAEMAIFRNDHEELTRIEKSDYEEAEAEASDYDGSSQFDEVGYDPYLGCYTGDC